MNIEYYSAFLLFAFGVAVLVFWQFLQRRRRDHPTGSLLLWRRVAVHAPALPKRRFQPDRHFWLQCSAVFCLAFALSLPRLKTGPHPARTLILVIDNGPSARAILPDGTRAWSHIQSELNTLFSAQSGFKPSDRLLLISSAPNPEKFMYGLPLTPEQARSEVAKLKPCISAPEPERLWQLLKEELRQHERTAPGSVAAVVLSARQKPAGASTTDRLAWRCLSHGGNNNTGLTAWGGAWVPGKDRDPAWELLIQARNFSNTGSSGKVTLEGHGAEIHLEQPLKLDAGQASGAIFRLPLSMLKLFQTADEKVPRGLMVRWQPDGNPDAWPEDDRVWLAYAAQPFSARPRVRIHGAAPALETLFKEALNAELLKVESKSSVDLEVYVDVPPDEAPPNARAHGVLLLAPQRGLGELEIGAETLSNPHLRLGETDPLTRGIADSAEGIAWNWGGGQYRKLEPLGAFKTLLADQAGHPVAGRMALKDGRPMFVLAFVPGAGFAASKKLDDPGLAAMLLRMLLESAGTRDPFVTRHAEEAEAASDGPFPLLNGGLAQDGLALADWEAKLLAANSTTGWGVLNAETSALQFGDVPEKAYSLTAAFKEGEELVAQGRVKPTSLKGFPFWPFCLTFALFFITLDWWWAGKPRKSK